jgi:mRNA-degrading endonuclease RelE of RelBE toxin-antitoxin system
MKVELSLQVVDFVKSTAPEPKRRLRRALRNLSRDRGDIRPLEGPLAGYCRLRVGTYRIIFAYSHTRSIQCIFAEHRSIVYELFAEMLREKLTGGDVDE